MAGSIGSIGWKINVKATEGNLLLGKIAKMGVAHLPHFLKVPTHMCCPWRERNGMPFRFMYSAPKGPRYLVILI